MRPLRQFQNARGRFEASSADHSVDVHGAPLGPAAPQSDGHARQGAVGYTWAIRGTFQANSDVFYRQAMPQTPALR